MQEGYIMNNTIYAIIATIMTMLFMIFSVVFAVTYGEVLFAFVSLFAAYVSFAVTMAMMFLAD
jgi:hypothetical protein